MFETIRKEQKKYDNLREELIKQARVVLKSSKIFIYSIHRGDKVKITGLSKEKKSLDRIASGHPHLASEAMYSEALQEYSEAMSFYYYSFYKRLVGPDKLRVNYTDYLMGICDLTGELCRRAVIRAISKDTDEVKQIYGFVDNIFHELIRLDPRNGALRRKIDSVKYNLKKIEEVLYELTIKGAG